MILTIENSLLQTLCKDQNGNLYWSDVYDINQVEFDNKEEALEFEGDLPRRNFYTCIAYSETPY